MNKFRENDYYNSVGGEITGTKCGEIFTTEHEIFNVLCTFCGTILKDIEGFTIHFKTNHNKQFEHDREIEIEELPNVETLIDPIGQCKLEVSNESEKVILENVLQFVDESNLQNECTDSNSILERNIHSRGTTEIEDKTSSSEQLKESHTKNKTRKISGSRMPTLHLCNICNKVFKQKLVLQSHIKYDHNTTYSLVDNLITKEGNQKEDRINLDPVQSIANDPLKCRYCDRRFKSRLSRFEHECLHTGDRPFKCELCDKAFRLQSTFKSHLQFHEIEKKINSREQPKESNDKNEPLKIIRSRKHTLHVCNICNKIFKQEHVLQSHIKYDHNTTYSLVDNLITKEGNQEEDKLDIDPAQSVQNDPLKCRYCDRRFRKRIYRFEHECLHTGERPYKCTICEKTFRLQTTLKEHIRFHENKKEFKCDICDKGFNSSINLTMHLRRHNNEKPYKCSYCDKRFIQNTEKQLHERIHTGEKPFQCTECGQRYSRSSYLGLHFRKKHVPQTPIKCEDCNKTFMSKEHLKKHQVVHKRDYRPYKCDVCDATFQRRYAFSEHKKLHSDELRYTCNICGKGFKQFAGLYSHKKSHGENIALQKSQKTTK